MDTSATSEAFVAAVRGADPAAARETFFRFIGVSPQHVDVARAGHASVMLEVSGLSKDRLAQSVPAIVVRYLAPEAAVYGKLDRARELLDAIDDPYYQAHGYRELFLQARDSDDLSSYLHVATTIDRSAGFRAGDGTSAVPLAGVEMLVDCFALGSAYGCQDVVDQAKELLSRDQLELALQRTAEFEASKPDAHTRRIELLSEGYY